MEFSRDDSFFTMTGVALLARKVSRRRESRYHAQLQLTVRRETFILYNFNFCDLVFTIFFSFPLFIFLHGTLCIIKNP